MRFRTALSLAVLFSVSGWGQDSKPADPVRATITRAIEWIERQSVPVNDAADAVMFRGNEESRQKPLAWVYGGTAGVLIFLENAAAVLNDAEPASSRMRPRRACSSRATRTRKAVRRGRRPAARIRRPRSTWATRASARRSSSAARLRGDAEAKAVAVGVGESLVARGKREGDTLHWIDEADIIFGAAGTALFLLDLGVETGDKRFLDAAAAAGRWLVAKAESEPGASESRERRLFWKCKMAGNRHMPNFSHGTAGVAYALARIGAATKDAALVDGAKAGAAWLMANSVCDGDECRWPIMPGQKVSLGGWCHGPPGTARLFLLLHAQTGEARYLDVALSSTRWLMSYAKAAESKAAASGQIPPSFCCGVAGAIDYFCDLYRVTGKQEYADFATRAGEYLIKVAKPDGAGVKWVNGASSHESSDKEHGIDLMLGASGDAFALLRLATLRQNPDPIRSLPDRAVSAK